MLWLRNSGDECGLNMDCHVFDMSRDLSIGSMTSEMEESSVSLELFGSVGGVR